MDVKLTIRVQDRTRAVAQRSGSSDVTIGRVHFERDSLEHQTLMMFKRWMENDRFSERRDVEVFGRHLYRVLFSDTIGVELRNALEQAANATPRTRLRIHLGFEPEAAELAGLPWEYLYYAESSTSGQFFCEGADLILSRYLKTGESEVPPQPVNGRKLRILVAVASPQGDEQKLPKVIHQPVVRFLDVLSASLPIELHVETNPTVPNFIKAMEAAKPDVLHFMGHGQFNHKQDQGEVALLDEQGAPDWRSDYDFVRYCTRVSGAPPPRVVVLHMCEGGKIDLRESFAGLAPNLISAGVQAVVAMQYTVKNRAAIDFSAAFYEELLQAGRPVDYAVQRGRNELARQSEARLFATPVLYVYSTDTISLTGAPAAAAQRPPVTPIEQPPPASDDQRKLAAAYFRAIRAIKTAALAEPQQAALTRRLDALRDDLKAIDASARSGELQLRLFNESDATFQAALYAMLEELA
jgi:hypothetical protein